MALLGVPPRIEDSALDLVTARVHLDSPFDAEPVTAEQFVLGGDYANQRASAWPNVVKELSNIFGPDPHHFAHQEAILKWAIGSGKSFLVSMAFAYMVYWTLNLRDPQAYLGLAPGSYIVWLNQSINENQARRVVFHEVRERIIQAPWFQQRGYLPNPRVKSELLFPKSIIIFPGNSSLTFPAGYNVLGGVIDEAAWFTEPIPGSEREDPASAIYDSILRRIKSRFGSRGLLLAISNPRHEDDFIERSYRFARFGNPERGVPPPPRTYASYAALWHSKPGPQKDDATGKWIPWNFVMFRQVALDGSVAFSMDIPDVFLADFQKNAEKAKRDLAAIASKKGVGFFWDPDIVWRPRTAPDQPGFDPTMRHPLDAHDHFFEWFRWPLDRPGICHAHVDLALTRDRAGLAVAHIEGIRDVAGEKRPVIGIDLMLEIAAPQGGQIDFQHVRNVLYTMLGRGFPIKYATFDGWQSVDSVQQLNKRGIEAEVMSVDRDTAAYDTFYDAVHESRLNYYPYLPLYECVKSLILVRGKKVDHTIDGKKDVTDAVAGVCQTLTERWLTGVIPAAGTAPTPVSASLRRGRVVGRPSGRRAVVT